MNSPTVEAASLSRSFGDKQVLRELDLSIGPPCIYGLLGPNGSGKTTLIKCLTGLLFAGAGQGRLLGADSRDLPAEIKARVGYVPQEVDLYGWMRVRQLIDFHAAFYDTWNRALERRLRDAFELGERERVATLSVGQRQRLAILVATAFEPEVLLLDEPASALDPASRRVFLESLLETITTGERVVLLSSHIVSDIERVSDRVGILQGGRLAIDADLADLQERVCKLRITAAPGRSLPDPLPLDNVLDCQRDGRSAMVTLADYSEATAARLAAAGLTIERLPMPLEDIYLALTRKTAGLGGTP